MDDLELLQRYVSDGDRDAVARLVGKYQAMVHATCLRRLACGADAEDATQQVFLALTRDAGRITSNVGGWLHRCAVNIATTMVRSRRNRLRREREKGRLADGTWRDGEAVRKESVAILDICLGELDPTDREILIQNYVLRTPQRAIALSMGVTQQAVAKRIGKTVARLRHKLVRRGVLISVGGVTGLLGRQLASASAAGLAVKVKFGAVAAATILAAAITYECAVEFGSQAGGTDAAVVARRGPSAAADAPAGGSSPSGAWTSDAAWLTAPPSPPLAGAPATGQTLAMAHAAPLPAPDAPSLPAGRAAAQTTPAPHSGPQAESPAVAEEHPGRRPGRLSASASAQAKPKEQAKGPRRAPEKQDEGVTEAEPASHDPHPLPGPDDRDLAFETPATPRGDHWRHDAPERAEVARRPGRDEFDLDEVEPTRAEWRTVPSYRWPAVITAIDPAGGATQLLPRTGEGDSLLRDVPEHESAVIEALRSRGSDKTAPSAASWAIALGAGSAKGLQAVEWARRVYDESQSRRDADAEPDAPADPEPPAPSCKSEAASIRPYLDVLTGRRSLCGPPAGLSAAADADGGSQLVSALLPYEPVADPPAEPAATAGAVLVELQAGSPAGLIEEHLPSQWAPAPGPAEEYQPHLSLFSCLATREGPLVLRWGTQLVPEPASVALLGAAAVVLLGRRRRRAASR